MDISLFPKGRYVAKKTVIRYKFPYGSHSGDRPFALIFDTVLAGKRSDKRSGKRNAPSRECWDFEAFRPDPFLDPIFNSKAVGEGLHAIVLYEKGCKIPRYIFIPESDQIFVNTR